MKDFFKSLSIKGIVVGFLAMYIAAIILYLSSGMGIAYLEYGSEFINRINENKEVLKKLMVPNKFCIYSLQIIGILPTILGGYIASRIAKKGIYINACLVGILNMLFVTGYSMEVIEWKHIYNWIVAIPAALLGGHLAKGKVQTLVANQKTERAESTET